MTYINKGTNERDYLAASAVNTSVMFGLNGNDTLIDTAWGMKDDFYFGGRGDDRFHVWTDTEINGGRGFDTVFVHEGAPEPECAMWSV